MESLNPAGSLVDRKFHYIPFLSLLRWHHWLSPGGLQGKTLNSLLGPIGGSTARIISRVETSVGRSLRVGKGTFKGLGPEAGQGGLGRGWAEVGWGTREGRDCLGGFWKRA